MSKPSKLTKTCSSCGQIKPLSAFQQLAEMQGIVYSNICASCRKAQTEESIKSVEEEKSSGSTTKVVIDSKAKVKGSQEIRDHFKRIEDDFFTSREQRDVQRSQKSESTVDLAKKEKKLRDYYQSFLDEAKKPKPSTDENIFGGENQKREAEKVDLSHPVTDMYRTPFVKIQSPIFKAFKKRMGNAPLVDAAEKAAENKNNAQSAEEKKNPLMEHLENRFKPGK